MSDLSTTRANRKGWQQIGFPLREKKEKYEGSNEENRKWKI